jgi:hypothetical protein
LQKRQGRAKNGDVIIDRPTYLNLSLQEGLSLAASPDWQYTEKMDGVRHELLIGGSIIHGEMMRDGSFYAFDIPVHNGVDIRKATRRERIAVLDAFNLLRPLQSNDGATLLTDVLAAGGEGIVAAHLDAPFNAPLYRCKRVETFDVRVCGILPGAFEIEFENQQAGKVPAHGHSASIGDILEIAAFKRTASGKFREPRIIRLRPDKI